MVNVELFCILLLIISGFNAEQNCDPLFQTLANQCDSLVQKMSNSFYKETNFICCINVRYNLCINRIRNLSVIHKLDNFCPEQYYNSKIDKIGSNPALIDIKILCENFETQTCNTQMVNNAFVNVKSGVNMGINRIENILKGFTIPKEIQDNPQNISKESLEEILKLLKQYEDGKFNKN